MALVVGHLGSGGVAVGEEYQAVVLLVLVIVVDGGLEVGAATACHANGVGCLFEQDGLLGGDFAVKLDYLDALNALLKEAVDDGKKPLYVLVGYTAADVDGDKQAGAIGILATHGVEAVAAVGAHACEVALGTEDAGAELAEDGTEVLLAHQRTLDKSLEVATE